MEPCIRCDAGVPLAAVSPNAFNGKKISLLACRFRDNVVVQGEPRIRFFVGAPLVASNGHRLGTLCYLGPEPRVTTAEEAMILANMAGGSLQLQLCYVLVSLSCLETVLLLLISCSSLCKSACVHRHQVRSPSFQS